MNTTISSTPKAYFMLPGFYEHLEFYKFFNKFLNTYPEAKYDNAEIYCYYGNIPFCIWDGGRIFPSYQPSTIEDINTIIEFYKNSKIRFIFTNSLLEEHHCLDKYNNIILNLFQSSNNEIVVNSSILENYIQKNYPDYSLISSTTKCLKDPAIALQELNKDQYKFICLDYNLNHNWEFLNNLTIE
jgi:hypothetical protein